MARRKSYRKSTCYRKGKNWSAKRGSFSNGRGQHIHNPVQYFGAVARNDYGFNTCYRTGNGNKIHNPVRYFDAVARDKYGFNR